MTKKSKRRRHKRRRNYISQYRIPLALMTLAGGLIVVLLFLARTPEPPAPPTLPKVSKPEVVDYSSRVISELEAILSAHDVKSRSIQRNLDNTPISYVVDTTYPPDELLVTLEERLVSIPGHYSVVTFQDNCFGIEQAEKVLVKACFIPSPQVADIPSGPILSIVMDDMGRDTYTAEKLVSLPVPVTFSILPGEPNAARVAEIANSAGFEVMLHVPMEPQGYPAVNPGDDALFVKYSSQEIRNKFEGFFEKVPYVIGANNHMGSRFTESFKALEPVMQSIREKRLFFLDSRTTGLSKVSDVAEKYSVPSLNRDVFLDNVADVDAISREIQRLENRARRNGQAIGICHPYPETLEALRRELPDLNSRGVTVVPVSVQLQKVLSLQGN